MKVVYDKLPGPMTLQEDMTLYGVVEGDLLVADGVTLNLFGVVAGNLDVAPGASVHLFGVVTGSVFNRGQLDARGVVIGFLSDVEGGSSRVDANAVVLQGG